MIYVFKLLHEFIETKSLCSPTVDLVRDGILVEEEPDFHLALEVNELNLGESSLLHFAAGLSIQVAAVKQSCNEEMR